MSDLSVNGKTPLQGIPANKGADNASKTPNGEAIDMVGKKTDKFEVKKSNVDVSAKGIQQAAKGQKPTVETVKKAGAELLSKPLDQINKKDLDNMMTLIKNVPNIEYEKEEGSFTVEDMYEYHKSPVEFFYTAINKEKNTGKIVRKMIDFKLGGKRIMFRCDLTKDGKFSYTIDRGEETRQFESDN